MPGPAPKPLEFRVMDGNRGHHKNPKHPPKFRAAIISPPEYLDEKARIEWQRLAPEMRKMSLLTAGDLQAFACYCQAVSNLHAAREAIEENGRVFITGKGYLLPRPEVAMESQAMKAIKDFAVQFGFTPSARSRIDLEPSKDGGSEDLD